MEVKVLGTGCMKCNKLYAETQKALSEAGIEATLEKVEGIEDIMNYGVMMTPALVIDEEVKSVGRIPKTSQIISWLEAAASEG